MTEPRIYSSPAGRADRRTEFVAFYEGTYPAVTGEVLALTGNLDVAQAVAGASYARTWQAWPAVRNLEWPVMWVRADAVRRMRRPPRGDRLLQHGLPALPEVALDPEDEVLVAGLQCLPAEHRLPLVLHYLGHVPVETITEWFGDPTEELEVRIDAGFDALVAILDWPDDADDADGEAGQGDAYDWTAEALESCAQRLRGTFPVLPPALVFRRATVKKVTRRGAPITAAAAAAAIGLVVFLSPAPKPAAQAAAFTAPPSPVAAAAAPAELDTVTADTTAPETTTAEPTSPAGTTTKSAVRRATTKKTASEGNAVAALPAVAVSTSPAVTSTAPTSTTPTSTTPTSTTPTTTAGAAGGETGTTGGETGTTGGETGTTGGETGAIGGETGGGTGTGSLPGSDSTATDSTGSSVVTTTDSTTPTTDETTTGETTSATTTRDHGQDDCPPTTTETADTTTADTTTAETTTTETTSVDPGTTETTTTETQPVLLSLINETNTTTPTVGTATGRSVRSATGQASE